METRTVDMASGPQKVIICPQASGARADVAVELDTVPALLGT
ncbi:MAG: hypothetical protein QCI82_09815 [Candidatus Thermoplasmatota archaeon]|nr:hypothetical protein [Candidatus Thermoplasmatota archaeon]